MPNIRKAWIVDGKTFFSYAEAVKHHESEPIKEVTIEQLTAVLGTIAFTDPLTDVQKDRIRAAYILDACRVFWKL